MVKNTIAIFIITFVLINFKLYAEEGVPEFPYDPEEKATETKNCARVCLRRKEICFKREENSGDFEQICQSQFIICINQCR